MSSPESLPQSDTGLSACPEFTAGGNISAELLSACIHCGLCLPACPTYLATGREMESPRGRIYLLSQWQQGNLELTPRLAEHIESCLGCLGCQTACPSGVQYEQILNQARPHLAEMRSRRVRKIMRFVFSKVLPDYSRLRLMGKLLRMWQSSGGKKILQSMPWMKKMLGRLDRWQSMLPVVPSHHPIPKQSWRSGEKRGAVNLFIGCIMDIFYNQVNHACQRLLLSQRRVVNVPEQTCCGALAFHAGEADIARQLAKTNIELFENQAGDIVVTAAGCGAMLKEYPHLFETSDDWHGRAEQFSARVRDITEELKSGVFADKPQPVSRKVAYHAACHLAHAQKIREIPEVLLSQVPGLQLIPLEESEHCCGSAGIYNLLHEELATRVLDRKIEYIKQTGADTVVTTNPGCMLQIENGLRDAGLDIKVKHLAELLDEAYSQPPA